MGAFINSFGDYPKVSSGKPPVLHLETKPTGKAAGPRKVHPRKYPLNGGATGTPDSDKELFKILTLRGPGKNLERMLAHRVLVKQVCNGIIEASTALFSAAQGR